MDNTFNKILFEIMEYNGQAISRLKLYMAPPETNGVIETVVETAAKNVCLALIDQDLMIANQLLAILDAAKTPNPANGNPSV